MVAVKKIAILIISIIEILLFSGVFYGFNSLIPIYKDAGVFSQFCDHPQNNETVTCVSQETNFGRAFSTWLIVQAVASFVLGVILDKCGIVVMKIIGSCCVLGGFLCLGFTPTVNYLIFIGGSLLTMSAYCIEISNITLSVIFTGHENMIVALYSALFDASSIVMTAIKYITDFGAPFWIVCTVYGCAGFVTLLGSIVFIKSIGNKNKKVEDNEQNKDQKAMNGDGVTIEPNETDCDTSSVLDVTIKYNESVKQRFPSLKKCFLSFEYLIELCYFVTLSFRFTFFLSQMSSQLTYLFPNDPDVIEHLLSVSNVFFLGSLFISPIFGILLDKYQLYTFRYLAKDLNVTSREIYNKINACFFVPSFFCTTAMLIGSLLMFVANKHLFYVVFICMTITRALLFAINGAYVFTALPKKYFGTLIGVIYFVTGGVNLLQQFLISYAAPDSCPDIVNYSLIALVALTLIHGFYLKFKK